MTDFIDEMAVFAELKMHWNSEHDRAVIARYLRQAYERGLEDAAKVAAEWNDMGTMLLRAGEMTAQEKRTAKAIVTSIVSAIRKLKEVE